VTAGIDTSGFFHDDVQAVDSPLSGLVAMLGAMQILGDSKLTQTYTRQLVFTALAGEPWGYMGSKRLLWDLASGGTVYTSGLNLDDIDQVVEVGQVGRALNANVTSLFAHAQNGAAWGDTTTLYQALQGAAALSSDVMNLSRASSANPGVPPSSLFSFLRAKPTIAGILLAEFDTQFINPYYHSSFDNGTFSSVEPLVATAVLLARTLHALAAPAGSPPLVVNITEVQMTVLSVAQCIMLDAPGMSCPLATSLLNPDFQVTDQFVSYAVKHYISTLAYIHTNPQEPFYKKNIYRFLWNYMGTLASVSQTDEPCAFSENTCASGLECIGWKGSNRKNSQLMGRCQRTTVRYSPSLSTLLNFQPYSDRAIGLSFSNASSAWEAATGWPADPLWVESNWPNATPYLRVLLKDSNSTLEAILGGGIAACMITAVLSHLAKKAFEKQAKIV